MTKTDLVNKISKDVNINKKQADKALNAFIEGLTQSMKRWEKTTFVGFGTFSVVQRAKREGINPQTKEKIVIPESKAPKFKAGKKLKEAVK